MENMIQLMLPFDEKRTNAILNVDEIAYRLNVDRNTILRWIKEGNFPNAFKARPVQRARWQIPQSDLDAYIERRRQSKGFCYVVSTDE